MARAVVCAFAGRAVVLEKNSADMLGAGLLSDVQTSESVV